MFEALKSLSPKQRFLGFIIVVLISAVTSLGTAYMSGSDCTEVSDKYTKSVENYNKLIEITDETQQKYLDAKKDIILIQEKLNEISEIMSGQSNERGAKSTARNYENDLFSSTGDESGHGTGSTGIKNDTLTIVNTPKPKKIIIKEKTIVTNPKAKIIIDSLLQITKKYDKKK